MQMKIWVFLLPGKMGPDDCLVYLVTTMWLWSGDWTTLRYAPTYPSNLQELQPAELTHHLGSNYHGLIINESTLPNKASPISLEIVQMVNIPNIMFANSLLYSLVLSIHHTQMLLIVIPGSGNNQRYKERFRKRVGLS